MTADPRAQDVLREYRRASARTQAHRDAVWSSIEHSIENRAQPALDDEAAPEQPKRRVAAIIALVVAPVTVVTLGLGLAPKLREPEATPPAQRQPAAEETPALAPARGVRPSTPPPQPPESAHVVRAAPPKPAVTRAPARVKAVAPPAAPGDMLREEMALIARARAAMREREPKRALEVLENHLRDFPTGRMREDRAALRIEALCLVGKRRQASIELERFERTHPASANLERLRSLCTETRKSSG